MDRELNLLDDVHRILEPCLSLYRDILMQYLLLFGSINVV